MPDFGDFQGVRRTSREGLVKMGVQSLLQPVMVTPTSAGDRPCSWRVMTNPEHGQGELGTDPNKAEPRTEYVEGICILFIVFGCTGSSLQCTGFSLWRLLFLQCVGALVVTTRLWSSGSGVMAHVAR